MLRAFRKSLEKRTSRSLPPAISDPPSLPATTTTEDEPDPSGEEVVVSHSQTFALLELPRELRDQIYEYYFDEFASEDGRIPVPASTRDILAILQVSSRIREESRQRLCGRYLLEFSDLPGMTTFDRRQFSDMRMMVELPLKTKHAFLETLYDLKDHFANHLLEYDRLYHLALTKKHKSEARRIRIQNERIDEVMEKARTRLLHGHLRIDEKDHSEITIVQTQRHYRITGQNGWTVDLHVAAPGTMQQCALQPAWVRLEGQLAHIGCLWLKGQTGDQAVRSVIKNSLQREDLDHTLHSMGLGKPKHSVYAWDMADCHW